VPGVRDSRFGVRGKAVGRRQAEKTRMDTAAAVPVPKPFMPHPNFSDEVNRNIVQSEIEGGVYLDELSEGAVLEVETVMYQQMGQLKVELDWVKKRRKRRWPRN
jgi:hypothetical protein